MLVIQKYSVAKQWSIYQKAKQNGKVNQQSANCIFAGYPNDSKVSVFSITSI